MFTFEKIKVTHWINFFETVYACIVLSDCLRLLDNCEKDEINNSYIREESISCSMDKREAVIDDILKIF